MQVSCRSIESPEKSSNVYTKILRHSITMPLLLEFQIPVCDLAKALLFEEGGTLPLPDTRNRLHPYPGNVPYARREVSLIRIRFRFSFSETVHDIFHHFFSFSLAFPHTHIPRTQAQSYRPYSQILPENLRSDLRPILLHLEWTLYGGSEAKVDSSRYIEATSLS